MKNIVAKSALLQEFQQRCSGSSPISKEEASLSGPMSEEDYRFEQACEQIFHTNGD